MKSSNLAAGSAMNVTMTVDDPVIDVAAYVQLANNPSVHTYHSLKTKIDQSTPKWLAHFLEQGGLDALVGALCQLAGHKFTNFSDAVLQLDCVSCVRAVINSSVGMQYIIQWEECVYKLIQALDTPNTLPKKQMFELLTAIAMYSMEGHGVVMRALQHYKKFTNQQHIFSILVSELKSSETATYRVTLMSFINVILRGHSEGKIRSRVRDQFIGLNLLDVISFIRKDDREPELAIQFEIFDSDKHDDEEILSREHGIDVNNPEELFSMLYSKTCLTPASSHLLHILQDLVLMSIHSENSEAKWSTLSELVHAIVGFDTEQLKACVECVQNISECAHKMVNNTEPTSLATGYSNERRESVGLKRNSQTSNSERLVLYTKPDDNVNHQTGANCINRRDSGISVTSPDSMPGNGFRRRSAGRESFGGRESCRFVRKPQKSVKPVIWEPLQMREAQKPLSVWRMVTERGYHQKISLDFTLLEDEFEQINNDSANADATNEIHLLEPEESLRLNLLLARLEAMPEELAQAVIEVDTTDLSPGTVQLLIDAIPPKQQIARIVASSAPHYLLAPAEQFLASLSEHTDYMTLLYGLKFKVTFQVEFPKLKTAFEAVTLSCKDVLHHRGLRDFLRVMLDAGNFLNANERIDPAAGIKLSSWKRLSKVRGHRHNINLLTFLVDQIERQNPDVLKFVDEFPLLEEASEQSFDDLRRKVSDLNMQMKCFLGQLSQSEMNTREHFQQFVEEVKKDLAGLHCYIAHLKGLFGQMAMYFCEDETTFDLQSCLKHLLEFIKLVQSAKNENHDFYVQKVVADKRKEELMKQLQLANIMQYFGKKADLCSSFVQSQNDPLVDHLLDEIHRGNICYSHESLPQTPDFSDKLCMSMIPRVISTPIDSLSDDLESSSFIFQAADPDGQIALTSFVDQLPKKLCDTAEDKELVSTLMTTGVAPCAESETLEDTLVSNHQPGKLAARCLQQRFTSENVRQELEITIYPKLASPAVHRKRGHVRCNSDLNRSRIVQENWKAYEKQKNPLITNDLESSSTVTSLGLETKIVKFVDVPQPSQKKVIFCEPEKPTKDKKKKMGFFQRISQAVLRQRNVNIEQDQGTQEEAFQREFTRGSKRWSGKGRRSRKSIDKENIFRENLV